MSYIIVYIDKFGYTRHHDYRPSTKQEALGVGHELCRDHVASFFRVFPIPAANKG